MLGAPRKWHSHRITDPQVRSLFANLSYLFANLSYQTDAIIEARRLVVAAAAGKNPVLAEILAWNLEYNNGTISDPQTIQVNGEDVQFWPVGSNASCSFMAGVRHAQRYQYAWCEGDEPTIRMVDDWRGYYGHY